MRCLICWIERRVVRISYSPDDCRRWGRLHCCLSLAVGNECVPWQPSHLLLWAELVIRIHQSGLLRLVFLGGLLLRRFCGLAGLVICRYRDGSGCWCLVCTGQSRCWHGVSHMHLLHLVGIDLRSTKTGSLGEAGSSRKATGPGRKSWRSLRGGGILGYLWLRLLLWEGRRSRSSSKSRESLAWCSGLEGLRSILRWKLRLASRRVVLVDRARCLLIRLVSGSGSSSAIRLRV